MCIYYDVMSTPKCFYEHIPVSKTKQNILKPSSVYEYHRRGILILTINNLMSLRFILILKQER